jgi:hypothetical protein
MIEIADTTPASTAPPVPPTPTYEAAKAELEKRHGWRSNAS